jgi:hypothetical protein
MKEIQPLLEKLAEKLGTTANYLWAVLLKQAPIAAATYFVQVLAMAVAWFFWYRVHKHLMKEPPADNYNDSYYEKYDIGAGLPMALIALFLFVLSIILVVNFQEMVSGFFNPDYWALNKILRSLKD